MREIKFRAWDKHSKKIGKVTRINFSDVQHTLVHYRYINDQGRTVDEQSHIDDEGHGVVALLQYTGLKDKNGKEIYEGDVLLFNNDYPNAQKMDWKCVVKYRKGSFVCEYPKDGVYNHFDSWNVPKVTWEVIGNIYENPSLLEVSQE